MSDAREDGPVPVIDAQPIDAPPPPDTALVRMREDLIGLWEFDDAAGTTGTTIADTSGARPAVPLTISFGSATFSGGMMTPNGIAVIASKPAPHINSNVINRGAVTLEAWVMPALAAQGSTAAPVVVAGLSASINARNISLMQAGQRWLARVRTTSDANGRPDLISTVEVAPGVMTHLVVVDDATRRALYVDARPDTSDPQPGPPRLWDKAYRMMFGNELGRGSQWGGTFALVAIYQRALSQAEIEANFRAGPSGR